MADDDDFKQWFDEHRAEFQAKIDAVDFWMKGELPHYLTSCAGKPTAEGFKAYLDERLANADPELKQLLEDGFICSGILAKLEAAPSTVMTSAELLQRLGLKPED